MEFLEENGPVAKQIVGKALLAAQAREASRKAKDLYKKVKFIRINFTSR